MTAYIDQELDNEIREIITEGEPLYQEYFSKTIDSDRKGELFDAIVGYYRLHSISRQKMDLGKDDGNLDFIRKRLLKLTYFANTEMMYDIDESPMGRLRIGRHFFRQVCCQDMYDRIQAGDVQVIPYEDSYTLSILDREHDHKDHSNTEYRCLSDECPYCGKELEFDDDFDIDEVTGFHEAMQRFYDHLAVDESTKRELTRREFEHMKSNIPELLELSAEAEREGRLKDAKNYQFSLLTIYMTGERIGHCMEEAEACWDKISELEDAIREKRMKVIDSHPYGRFVLGTDGIERACCKDMRDVIAGERDIDKKDAPAAMAFLASELFTFDPKDPLDLSRQLKDRKCPFCGREMELSDELRKYIDSMNEREGL